MDASGLRMRPAKADDARRIAALVVSGFETFRDFAPAGWSAPAFEQELDAVRSTLAHPSSWCRLAEDDQGLAGHVGWHAASIGRSPSEEPGLAHLWALFVRRDWWGRGLATILHDAALAAAASAGFTGMRLVVPADHGRGRRFYEREGWTPAGEPFDHEELGMALAEYRRPL